MTAPQQPAPVGQPAPAKPVPVGQPVAPVDFFRRMPGGGTTYVKTADQHVDDCPLETS